MIAVGQIAELELKDIVVPYQRRSESGAETEKKQTTVNMAAERLHCGIVNDARRLPQEPRKIESSPALPRCFGSFTILPPRTGDGNPIETAENFKFAVAS